MHAKINWLCCKSKLDLTCIFFRSKSWDSISRIFSTENLINSDTKLDQLILLTNFTFLYVNVDVIIFNFIRQHHMYLGTVIQNEDYSAHYQSFSFGGWYFSNGKIKIELTVVWTFQAQDVWFEFSKLLIRNSRKYVLRTRLTKDWTRSRDSGCGFFWS